MIDKKQQALLVKVMNLFSEQFNKKVVLRGGMVLRVLGCECLINDLDYLFMPYKSKKELSAEFNLPPRLIQVLDYSVALAHKMAAWNERRLIRDVYDIWFYLKMGIQADRETLQQRFKKCYYSKLIKKEDYFKGATVEDFYDFLLMHVNTITDQEIIESLGDYLKKEDIYGLSMKFRTEIVKLN